MKWGPELAEVYAEALVGNSEMQTHFEQAIAKEGPTSACEASCFCLRSMIVQAAGDAGVDWASQSVWPLHASRRGAHSPLLHACRGKRRVFMEALRTGQPLHACVWRQYKIQVRCSKRAYTRKQRDVSLGRLYSKYPDVHAVLRQSKRTQTTPVAQSVWEKLVRGLKQDSRHTIWFLPRKPKGRNLQPIYISMHLQHAACTIKPERSSRLHTAFIYFN
eukprot:1141003-Pelagomonas_calceolata.AAC.3